QGAIRDLAIQIAAKYNSALSEVFPTWESYSLPKKEKAMLAKRYIATIVLLVGCVLLGPAFARADTITTFNVDGVFRDPFSGTFSGTITVDVTTGTLTAVDITFPGSSAYNAIVASEPISFPTSWAIFANTGDVNQKLELTFFTDPTGGSLVGLTGGSITGSISDCCTGLGGFITPLTSVTAPEPSSLALLVAGFLAVCGLGFARTRQRTD